MAGIDNPTAGTPDQTTKDIIKAALADLKSGELDITAELQDYPVYNVLMQDNRINVESGNELEWRVHRGKSSGQAGFVHLFEPVETGVSDALLTARLPWCHAYARYSWDRRELKMNQGKAKIIDTVRSRVIQSRLEAIDDFEDAFWADPSPTNDKVPYGAKYHLPQIVSGSNNGHNDEVYSGFTYWAGINPSTYSDTVSCWQGRWSVTSGDFDLTDDDLPTVERAMLDTRFKPPMNVDEALQDRYDLRMYGGRDIILAMSEAARQQNTNLGNDLIKYHNATVFKGVPVQYVPALNDDTTYPLWALNLRNWQLNVLDGEWWLENDPVNSETAPNVWTVQANFTYQFKVVGRRNAGFVISRND